MPLTWALTLQESTPPAVAGRGYDETTFRYAQARSAYGRTVDEIEAAHVEEADRDALLSPDEAVVRAGQLARRLKERTLSLTSHSPRFFGMLFG